MTKRLIFSAFLASAAVCMLMFGGSSARAANPSPGVISTIAGPLLDGAPFSPYDVAVNATATLIVSDLAGRRVWQLENGVLTTIVGCTACLENGEGVQTALNTPYGVAFDNDGSVLVADYRRCQVLRLTSGVITPVAGVRDQCAYSGDGGPANGAHLNQPASVAADVQGNIYISEVPESGNGCRVRRISQGVIDTLAGTGSCGSTGDGGPALAADIIATDVATDAAGAVYFAQLFGSIRKVDGGVISTVVGTGVAGWGGDGGDATLAQLSGPRGLAVAPNGDLYIADTGNEAIRKVAGGIITTVAGSGPGNSGYAGDGGAATQAWLSLPTGVAADAFGNFYIADWGNDRVRIVYGAAPATPTATATPSPTLTTSAPASVRPVRTATPTTTATPQSLPTSIPTPTAPAPGSIAPNGQPPLAPSSNDGNEGDRAGASARPARLPNSGAGTRNTVGITDGIVFAAWAGVALLVSGAALRARKRG